MPFIPKQVSIQNNNIGLTNIQSGVNLIGGYAIVDSLQLGNNQNIQNNFSHLNNFNNFKVSQISTINNSSNNLGILQQNILQDRNLEPTINTFSNSNLNLGLNIDLQQQKTDRNSPINLEPDEECINHNNNKLENNTQNFQQLISILHYNNKNLFFNRKQPIRLCPRTSKYSKVSGTVYCFYYR